MQKTNLTNKDKKILLLFPWKTVGEKLLVRFLEKGNRVVFFTFSAKEESFFRNRYPQFKNLLNVYSPQDSPEDFWEQLSPADKEIISQPDILLNFIGNELIKIKVEGEGENWKIDSQARGKRRMDFIDLLLRKFPIKKKSVWINVVYGMGGQSNKTDIFCSTRYGVMGITEILKMNPALSGVKLVNICLTYLKHKEDRGRVLHCSHCVAQKFGEETINFTSPESIAAFLVEKSEELLSAENR